jgi:hypothetical protein
MVEFEVRKPIGRFDQPHSLAGHCIGERRAIWTFQEPDLLRRSGSLLDAKMDLRTVPPLRNVKTYLVPRPLSRIIFAKFRPKPTCLNAHDRVGSRIEIGSTPQNIYGDACLTEFMARVVQIRSYKISEKIGKLWSRRENRRLRKNGELPPNLIPVIG